jgi:hypothetical protein
VEVIDQPPMVTVHYSGFDEKTQLTFTQLQDMLDLYPEVSVVRQTLSFTLLPLRTVSILFCRTHTRRPVVGAVIEKTKGMKRGGSDDSRKEARNQKLVDLVAKSWKSPGLERRDKDHVMTLLEIASSLSDNPPLDLVLSSGDIDDRHMYVSVQGYPEVDAFRLKQFVNALPYHVADVFVDMNTGRISVSLLRSSVSSSVFWRK